MLTIRPGTSNSGGTGRHADRLLAWRRASRGRRSSMARIESETAATRAVFASEQLSSRSPSKSAIRPRFVRDSLTYLRFAT